MQTEQEQPHFSLVVGGPLYQILLRSRLARDPLGLLHRRVIVFAAVAWLPLAVLAVISGRFAPSGDYVSFLHDIEAHVRLLIVLPLLMAAEIPVHQRIHGVVQTFLAKGIVPPEERTKFFAAVEQATRWRNSRALEIVLLIAVYTIGHWLWREQIAFETTTWYALTDGSSLRLTLPGYWYAFVSIPLFQFILIRWYARFAIWFWLLLKITRLKLHLIATDADRAAGLAFVGNSVHAFGPLLFAQGALLSGWIADRVIHGGENLLDFKVEAALLIAFQVGLILAPLCVFTPLLAEAKQQGRREYGLLVAAYTRAFERKWVHGERPADEPFLGSADIQSLADLGNAYSGIQQTRLVPFGMPVVMYLVLAIALPLVPLAFTVLSLSALVSKLLKVLF